MTASRHVDSAATASGSAGPVDPPGSTGPAGQASAGEGWRLPSGLYAQLYAAAPVALLVLDRDLVMVEANAAYRRSVGWSDADAAAALGRSVFEVFPDNPARVNIDGVDQVTTLREFMTRAVTTGQKQVVTGLRYDIPVPGTDRFDVRHWNVTEVPVLDATGQVAYLLHFNEDITDLVERLDAGEAATVANHELQQRVARAQSDLLHRAQQLQELNLRLQAVGEHDRTVAAALQQAMLTDLPEPDHLHLVARYRTAAGDQVGGDWYDAVVLPNGTTTLVIGDVIGHDITAAATMGQLRSMLRALAWQNDQPPSVILGLLDRAIRDLRLGTMLTAILAQIEQTDDDARTGLRTLRWSNAGHPPPLLLSPTGDVTALRSDPADTLLGVAPDRPRRDHTHTIEPGTSLLLYTDGLVETRNHDLDHGMTRLHTALHRHAALPAEALLDAVLDDTVGDQPGDDVAVLLVRFHPRRHSPPHRGRTVPPVTHGPDPRP